MKALLLLAIILPASLTLAQTTPAVPQHLPKDPKGLMRLAVNLNGLNGDNIHPWHLKATFKLFDDAGNPSDEGSYEEFWASPTKYKSIYTSKTHTQTQFGTIRGVAKSGSYPAMPQPLYELPSAFISTLPNLERVAYGAFTFQKVEPDGVGLSCIKYQFTADAPVFGPTYCLDPAKLTLRVSVLPNPALQIFHNSTFEFQGRFIPADVTMTRDGKTVLTAHLETLDLIPSVQDSDFEPTPDAVLPVRRITLSVGVAAGILKTKTTPILPPEAISAHISGTVVLDVTIDTQGNVKDATVISGPAVLQQPALDSVKKWTYRPYLLNGTPVEVHTTVNLDFPRAR